MKKLTVGIAVLIIALCAWAPWLSSSLINTIVNSRENCYEVKDSRWVPFGRIVEVSFTCPTPDIVSVDLNGKTHSYEVPTEMFITFVGVEINIK